MQRNGEVLLVYCTRLSQPVKKWKMFSCIFVVMNIFLISLFFLSALLPFSHHAVISSAGTDLISGQQVNLSCSIGRPLPSELRVKWFPPTRSSQPSLLSDHHPAHLAIPEVGTGDGGKWRCELWQNNTRLTSAVITLKIGECRKWERGRKCDRAWPCGRSLLYNRNLVLHDVFSVLYTVWWLSVSVVCRTQDDCVDAGDHMQRHSHRSPPPHPRSRPLPAQTSTVKSSLFLLVRSHWIISMALRAISLPLYFSLSLWLTLAEDETPQASTLPMQKVRTTHFLDRWNGSKHTFTLISTEIWICLFAIGCFMKIQTLRR